MSVKCPTKNLYHFCQGLARILNFQNPKPEPDPSSSTMAFNRPDRIAEQVEVYRIWYRVTIHASQMGTVCNGILLNALDGEAPHTHPA